MNREKCVERIKYFQNKPYKSEKERVRYLDVVKVYQHLLECDKRHYQVKGKIECTEEI